MHVHKTCAGMWSWTAGAQAGPTHSTCPHVRNAHQIDPSLPHATRAAKDLIQRLLSVESAERLSADQAINHPWLQVCMCVGVGVCFCAYVCIGTKAVCGGGDVACLRGIS